MLAGWVPWFNDRMLSVYCNSCIYGESSSRPLPLFMGVCSILDFDAVVPYLVDISIGSWSYYQVEFLDLKLLLFTSKSAIRP